MKFIYKIIFCAGLLFVMSVINCNSDIVHAQSSTKAQKGLTVSPIRSELEIAPGVSMDGVLTVTNSTKETMVVDLTAESFSVINQQYDYAFTSESEMTKWVSFSDSKIELAAGESKKANYTIGVPLSAEPGGRYISLFASTNMHVDSDSSIVSRQRVASLLYLTVTGKITRSGNLIYLTSPNIVTEKVDWSMVLQNTGTTHFRSRYDVKILSIINNEVVATSQGDALILPGSLRLITDGLPSLKLPGLYKVVYTIGLGDTPARVETRYLFYSSPLVLIFVILIILASIYTAYRLKCRKAKN
ncbi:hypothetical protein CVV43_00445 [Candidatus Saccharibacteria bacterium HGW-Saccharibacteria-1]|jgi:hypothetical protein|nr:MAG: hypothetical protein CVV43_00445 [Candidatus Saccharibacteria bacterium HGW-Saccharibacteria-1]